MSQIIVGYDGSDCAKAAVALAIDVGRAYGDDVVLAFCYDVSPVGGELGDYVAALKDVADQRAAEASDVAAALGATVETIVVRDAPAGGLAQLASERDARMVVVGTHGQSPLRAALLGSTPHKLLQLCDRPVLVVPAPVSDHD